MVRPSAKSGSANKSSPQNSKTNQSAPGKGTPRFPGKPFPVYHFGLGRIGLSLEKDPHRQKPCTHAGTIQKLPGLFTPCLGIDPRSEAREDWLSFFSKSPAKAPSVGARTRLPLTNLPENGGLVVLSVPSKLHGKFLTRLLRDQPESGRSLAILAEKPVCLKPTEWQSLNDPNLKKAARLTWVNFERRYHPHYLYLRDQLEAEPEEILGYHGFMAVGGRFPRPGKSAPEKDSPLYHDGSHLVDILAFLTPGPANFLRKAKIELAQMEPRRAFFHWSLVLPGGRRVPYTLELVTGAKYFAFDVTVRARRRLWTIGNGYLRDQVATPSPYYQNFLSLTPPGGNCRKKEADTWRRGRGLHASPFINLYREIHGRLWGAIHRQPVDWLSPRPSTLTEALNGIGFIHRLIARAGSDSD